MKKIIFLSLCLFVFVSNKNPTSSECDIETFYKGVEPSKKTKILNSSDDLEDVKLLLIPTDIDKGNYTVNITRKDSNLYEIEGKNIYIETKYCYEYSYSQEVILKVESSYGYTKGKIIF